MIKITKRDQRIVADVLIQFTFTKDFDDFIKVWDEIFHQYGLCHDPFTFLPCTPEEYCKSKLMYEKQLMIDKYGHCDGLD